MKSVKVILNQDVYNLGEEGDVREVAPGYARNYLLPQEMAVAYTKRNLAIFEQKKETIEKRKGEKRDEAKGLRERIEAMAIELEMPAGDTGKLFGSVNSATIAEKLQAEGLIIERKKIDVPDNNIKMVGDYSIRVRIYGDEIAELKVVVNPVGGKKVVEQTEKKEELKDEAPAVEAVAADETPVAKAEVEEAVAPAEEETPAEEEAPVAEAPVEEAEAPAEEEEPAAEAEVKVEVPVAEAPAEEKAEEKAEEEAAGSEEASEGEEDATEKAESE
jgi:large subunit ribosomal protein L9